MGIALPPQEYIIKLSIAALESTDLKRVTKELRIKELLSQLQGTPQEAESIAKDLDSQ